MPLADACPWRHHSVITNRHRHTRNYIGNRAWPTATGSKISIRANDVVPTHRAVIADRRAISNGCVPFEIHIVADARQGRERSHKNTARPASSRMMTLASCMTSSTMPSCEAAALHRDHHLFRKGYEIQCHVATQTQRTATYPD